MLKHLIYTFFSRGSVAVINFAVLLLTSRFLGSSLLGQASLLILNITITQAINEIYTGYALVHFIPGHALRTICRNGWLWTLFCCGAVSLVFLIIDNNSTALHSFILSLAISAHSFHCVILLGRERFRAYNLLIFLQPFLMLLTLAFGVFVLKNSTFKSYLSALYLSYCGSAIISAVCVLPLLKSGEKKVGLGFGTVLGKGVVNQLGNLAHTLSNRLNYYLIGSVALVGVYSGGTSLIESVWIIGNSISPILLSRVANQRRTEGNDAKLTLRLAQLSFFLSTICVLIIFLLPVSFFVWLLGPDFSDVKSVLLNLSPGILCISFSTVISHHFSGAGNQRVQLSANLLGLLITVCTAPFLIPAYGLNGACYSASLAYLAQALVNSIVFMRQQELAVSELFRFGWSDLLKKLK